MRIVHVANFYGPASGGIRTTMHHLARGYIDAGHDSVLIVPGDRARDEECHFGRVITVQAPTIPRSGGYRAITDVNRVRGILDALAPDRLEVSDRFTLRGLGKWARGRGVPSVMWAHERLDGVLTTWLPGPVPTGRLTDSWNRSTAAMFDRIVCSTAYARTEFDRIGATNVTTVPLGVDLEFFNPNRRDESLRDEFLVDDATALIVMCSRLSKEKRPEVSLRAIASMTAQGMRPHLVVMGTGPMEERLRGWSLGLPVTFLGHVSDREHLAAVLASADALIAPGPYETFCLAALESLASGTPVVAHESGALGELLTGSSGRLADGSPDSFADELVDLLELPDLLRDHAARQRAWSYPWSATVGRMLAVHGLGLYAEPAPTPIHGWRQGVA